MDLARIVQRGNWAVLLALTTALGCGSPPDPTGKKPPPPEKKPETPVATRKTETATTNRTAEQFAAAFLATVQAGTATPDALSTPFRSLIAEPVLEADHAAGYSHAEAEKWLKQYASQSFRLESKPVFSTADATGFRGTVGQSSFSLRVVKTATGWVVDWFAPCGPVGVSLPTNSAESFAAAAFLDAVVSKSERFVEGMLTSAGKSREAPPFASDKARGYNRGVLQRRIEAFRGGASSYSLAAITGDTVTGTLGDKPFTLKLSQGIAPGQWLVDTFEKK